MIELKALNRNYIKPSAMIPETTKIHMKTAIFFSEDLLFYTTSIFQDKMPK